RRRAGIGGALPRRLLRVGGALAGRLLRVGGALAGRLLRVGGALAGRLRRRPPARDRPRARRERGGVRRERAARPVGAATGLDEVELQGELSEEDVLVARRHGTLQISHWRWRGKATPESGARLERPGRVAGPSPRP